MNWEGGKGPTAIAPAGRRRWRERPCAGVGAFLRGATSGPRCGVKCSSGLGASFQICVHAAFGRSVSFVSVVASFAGRDVAIFVAPTIAQDAGCDKHLNANSLGGLRQGKAPGERELSPERSHTGSVPSAAPLHRRTARMAWGLIGAGSPVRGTCATLQRRIRSASRSAWMQPRDLLLCRRRRAGVDRRARVLCKHCA
jgi:hypothetical protein